MYSREWSPPFWRGSLDEAVAAGRAALDELGRQNPEGEIRQSVSLGYADGSTQEFGFVDTLQESASTIDPGEVTAVSIHVEATAWGKPTASAQIEAKAKDGLSVKAEGTETFASGMVATLKSRLGGGADAGEQAAEVPLRFIDWLFFALIPVAFVGMLVFEDQQFEYQDTASAIAFALFVSLIPTIIALAVFGLGQISRSPLRFVLVAEGEQFPDEGERRTGPIWRAKAWFEKHPLVAVVTLLVIGALLGRAAELLKF